MEIIKRGSREYYKTEDENNIILTSVEKNKYGCAVVLKYTKDKEESERAIKNFLDILFDRIIP